LQSKGNSVIDAIVLDDDASVEHHDDKLKEADDHEKRELHASTKDEPIPTSKTAFKSHPIYVIPSVLNANEVLVPDAKKRFCGSYEIDWSNTLSFPCRSCTNLCYLLFISIMHY
jgi:xeroderma pigmentosum group C-complementing protein